MDEKSNIYSKIKRDIIEFKYKPGEILNEVELAEEFGVSRTPVRTALQELERDSLLSIVPRYGAQVSAIDFRNIKALFEVTKRIDPFATRLAVKKVTPDQLAELKAIIGRLEAMTSTTSYQEAISEDERFHEILFEACGNVWLTRTAESLHIHTERLWHFCNDYFEDMTIFTRTFSLIVKAIEEGDEDAAERYSTEHIDDFLDRIRESLF